MENNKGPEPVPEKISDEASILLDEALSSVPDDAGAGPDAEPETPEINLELLSNQAGAMVAMVADGVEGLHPALKYDDPTRSAVSSALVPVMAKYGGELPPWFAAYQEEIGLAFVLAGVAYGSIKAVKAYDAEQAELQRGADATAEK